jgi:hypothetical protein
MKPNGPKSGRSRTSPRRLAILVAAVALWSVFLIIIINHEYAVTLLPERPQASAPDGVVYQTTDFSCGPASLATIFRHYNIIRSEREWAELSGTTISLGTTLPGLIRAAESVGFTAIELNPSYEQLGLICHPAIIFQSNEYHLVTFWGMDENGMMIIRDPVIGRVLWGPAEYRLNASHYPRMLVLYPGSVPQCDPEGHPREIGRVQNMLRTLRIYQSGITGRWNDRLTSAIRQFQTEMHLEPSGVVDPATSIYLEGAWRTESMGTVPPLMQIDRTPGMRHDNNTIISNQGSE